MKKRLDRKIQRKKEAFARNELWSKMSPEEQLKELDLRFGIGLGAKKQRKRIEKIHIKE